MFSLRMKTMAATAVICLFAVMSLQAAMEDPTRPPTASAHIYVAPAKQSPRWVLTSTLVSAERRSAVVNDRVVMRGDRINGATIISIQPSTVRLRVGGRDITLMMLKKNIKSLSRMATAGQHNSK